MIDWITCRVPFWHDEPIQGGIVQASDECGEVEFTSRRWKKFQGSFDSTIQVKTNSLTQDNIPGELIISGNPVKFLQGHNLFGHDDFLPMVYDVLMVISDHFNLPQTPELLNRVLLGDFSVSRVDINYMYDFGNVVNVEQFLSDVLACARTRAGTALSKGETVYLNKKSKRWSFKLYNKLDEISANKKHQRELPPDLNDWLIGKCRLELTLKSNELREKGLHNAKAWKSVDAAEIFKEYVGRIEMKEQTVDDKILAHLTTSLTGSYCLWKDGHDLKAMYSKSKFYAHRKKLLEFGVDISVPAPAKPKTAQIIPINRVIEVKAAEPPFWVYGTDWFYEPSRRQLRAI